MIEEQRRIQSLYDLLSYAVDDVATEKNGAVPQSACCILTKRDEKKTSTNKEPKRHDFGIFFENISRSVTDDHSRY